jgi:AraC-like DNA-binding protein
MRIERSPEDGLRVWWSGAGGVRCLRDLARRSGYRVGQICVQLDCDERYFRRVFLRDVGIPPKDWLREERRLAAERRLAEGVPAWRVARDLGFADPSSFRREFRAVHGVVPRRWHENGLAPVEAGGRRAG